MRLSEAIRLGAMLRPQTRGSMFKSDRSCALGAGMEAVGLPYGTKCDEEVYGALARRWPVLYEQVASPIKPSNIDSLACMIVYLNDFEGWTRERIADWVAGIEPVEVVTSGSEAARADTSDGLQPLGQMIGGVK